MNKMPKEFNDAIKRIARDHDFGEPSDEEKRTNIQKQKAAVAKRLKERQS